MATDFHILSLDGGGTWALIQAMALGDLYGQDTPGRDILRRFRLAIANSGGSIVLGGLVENLTPKRIVERFMDDALRRTIFHRARIDGIPERILGVGPRYETAAKLRGLRTLMPETGALKLSELRQFGLPWIMIVGFDYERRRAVFLRSSESLSASSRPDRFDPTLAEAIHASTNAPVNYFDQPAAVSGCLFWDGAVGGYNNPVLAGVTEALANGFRHDQIAVLSLGTGNVVLPLRGGAGDDPDLTQARDDPAGMRPIERLTGDLEKLASSILGEPPDAASYVAHVMMGDKVPGRGGVPDDRPVEDGRVVRMNPLIAPRLDAATRRWALPAGFERGLFRSLVALDMDAVAPADVADVRTLARLWIDGVAMNQPIRMRGDILAPEIGHATYAAAKEAWRRWAAEVPGEPRVR